MKERDGVWRVSSVPDRWLQDSLKKRKPPGRSQPSIFSMRTFSSLSLRYISSQLEKMKSILRRTSNRRVKNTRYTFNVCFLFNQEHFFLVSSLF